MTIKVQTPDGGTAHFPDGTSAADIESALNQAFPQGASKPADVSAAGDVAMSAGTGIVKGLAGAVTLPMMAKDALGALASEMADQTVGRAVNRLTKGTWDAPTAPAPKTALDSLPSLPRQGDVVRGIESVTGELHKPQTAAGKYAETIGEFLPMSLAGPGGMVRNAMTFGVVPGAASEAAGQYAKGSGYEGPARIAGALAGGVAGIAGGKALSGAKNFTATTAAANEISDVLNVPNIPGGAVRRVADNVAADNLTPAVARQRAAELGDDAMLLDMGRQVGGRAEAIASQPGRGQNTVLDAVEDRVGQFGDQTAQRIKDTLDRFIGPSPNVVETQNRINQIVDSMATPAYRSVMSRHPVVWDETLATLAQRPVIAQGMRDAISLARNYGEEITNLGRATAEGATAQPSLQFWDYVKKSIDHRINARMERGGLENLNGREKADLGGLMDAKRALTDYLDNVTSGDYARARAYSATKFEVREAGEFGRRAFQPNLLPEQFAARIADMSLPEQEMARTMMRREIERVIDTARNDGAAARRFLDTTQNGQKIEAIFGPQALREIENRLAAETQFQNIKTKVADNSRTAVRRELVKDTAETSAEGTWSTSIPGLIHAGARGGLNYIRNNGMSNTRDAIADLLTTRGPQMQDVIEVMNRLAGTRAANSARAPTRLPLSLVPNSLLALPASQTGK